MRLIAPTEALPGKPVTNADMDERFGLHEQWLTMMTGNTSRHFCDPQGTDGTPSSTSDLAVEAGRASMTKAGVGPEDIDFVVLTTASPDHLMPATVNLVTDRLGIDGVPALQVTSGCAGAIQGLFTARAMLATGARRGLVIGADSCLKTFPSEDRLASMKPAELVNFALFGDGGGAVVVDDLDGPGYHVDHIFTRGMGLGRPPAQIIRYYGTEGCPTENGRPVELWGEEDYTAISEHVPGLARLILDELSAETRVPSSEVQHMLIPQLNGAMTEKIRVELGVTTDQAVSCVAETGNNGNALPFIQLARTDARIGDGIGVGGRLFIANVESSKWLIGGVALTHVPDTAGGGGR